MSVGNLARLRDNNRKALHDFLYTDSGIASESKSKYIKSILDKYEGRALKDLQKESPGLLVFPVDASAYVDDVEKISLFDIAWSREEKDYVVETGNLMGAFGIGDIHISIGSRFDKDDDKPYFMRYILLKVLGMHVLDLPTYSNADQIDELYVFLFPMALTQALAKGLFKAYRRFEYNDANIKGPIDIARHLRTNVPFRGRVAYATREHTVDNPILQLVRHVIEFIKAGPYREILSGADKTVKEAVAQVVAATPTYVRQERAKVIAQNLRPVRHPYFGEYTFLQKISLQILRHEKMSHGDGSDQLKGIVFDGSWLWEEYLNKVMEAYPEIKRCGVCHPRNKLRTEPIHIYEPRKNSRSPRKPIYPDFLLGKCDKRQKYRVVLDAKYKKAFVIDENDKAHFRVSREDRYQMISYLHLTCANRGIFVCPMNGDEVKSVEADKDEEDGLVRDVKEDYYVEGKLLGYGGEIAVVPFGVPSSSADFKHYCAEMKKAEEAYCSRLWSVIKNNLKGGK